MKPLRRATIRTLVLAAALSASAAPLAAQTLAERIDAVVSRAPWDRAHWGIEVFDPASGETLYRRDADRLFVPASNLKLIVSAAAAERLDPGYRYTTTLLATGPVEGGVLKGDLVLQGRGDPTISGRYEETMTAVWEALADSLAARGVRRVAGRVVADATHFDAELTRSDWEQYDLLWWYAAPVAALGFNDNAIDFRIEPGARVGEPARVGWKPETSALVFVNRTRTVPAGAPATWDLDRVPGTDTVFAYGDVPADARPKTEYFAVRDPALYAGTVFREVLERKGIAVDADAVRAVYAPAASPAAGATRLVDHRSPALDSIVGPILGSSQNWFAEILAKTLGREVAGQGSWQAGLEVEREFLTGTVGIDPAAFRLRDASGLSSANLVTPHALVQLLAYVRRAPRQRLTYDALPVSGAETGSLRARLTDLKGRVRAKTGSIGNVDSLSGFVTTDDGRELVFAIIANNTGQPSSEGRKAIDEVVRAIAAGD